MNQGQIKYAVKRIEELCDMKLDKLTLAYNDVEKQSRIKEILALNAASRLTMISRPELIDLAIVDIQGQSHYDYGIKASKIFSNFEKLMREYNDKVNLLTERRRTALNAKRDGIIKRKTAILDELQLGNAEVALELIHKFEKEA